MSSRFSHTIARHVRFLLAAAVALPGITHAADPNRPRHANFPVVKQNVAVGAPAQTPRKPPSRPATPTPASFTPQMPLGEAVDILRNCTTPPLNIVVLWRSLDSAGIYRDTPIGIDGQPGLRVGQYLDLLVLSLSAGALDQIGYTIHGGVITIGTTTVLPARRQITRVYDISDLVAPPAGFGRLPMGFGGMYGNQMMGLPGGYGAGLGAGYGIGSPYLPGGSGNLRGLVGSAYGGTRTRSRVSRGR